MVPFYENAFGFNNATKAISAAFESNRMVEVDVHVPNPDNKSKLNVCGITTQGEEESQIKCTPDKVQVEESQMDLPVNKVSEGALEANIEEEKKMDVIDNVSENTDDQSLSHTMEVTDNEKRTCKIVTEQQMKQSDQLKHCVQSSLPKTPIRRSTAT